jgi:hypothetical protein
MDGDQPGSNDETEHQVPLMPFGDELDVTLVEEMLTLKISDRLRTLSRYVNGLRRFHPV